MFLLASSSLAPSQTPPLPTSYSSSLPESNVSMHHVCGRALKNGLEWREEFTAVYFAMRLSMVTKSPAELSRLSKSLSGKLRFLDACLPQAPCELCKSCEASGSARVRARKTEMQVCSQLHRQSRRKYVWPLVVPVAPSCTRARTHFWPRMLTARHARAQPRTRRIKL
eukprot:3068816-Pleurochrysis_carterae.AAC.3